VALGLALILTGCAWTMSDPMPSDWPVAEEPTCETYHLETVADGLVAVMLTGYGLCDGFACPSGAIQRALPLTLAALFWTSVYKGASRSTRCVQARRPHELYRARIDGKPMTPPPTPTDHRLFGR